MSGPVDVAAVDADHLDDGAAGIGMLTVDPAQQGRGLGSALMDFAGDRARSAGRTSAQLDLLVPASGTHPAEERLAVPYDVLVWRSTL